MTTTAGRPHILQKLKNAWDALLQLVFPLYCPVCEGLLFESEKAICLKCEQALPRTFHSFASKDNSTIQKFGGRIPLSSAASCLMFKNGNSTQKLLHAMKYKNRPEVGNYCGEMMAQILREFPTGIDWIVAVPMHQKKKKKRGYNQSEKIAEGLSRAVGLPTNFELVNKVENTGSQTKLSKQRRWQNVNKVFRCSATQEELEGKHILLVDDVLTTGATLEACAQSILSVNCNCKISVATLAVVIT